MNGPHGDGQYDDERDRRVCPACGEIFPGGPTGTGWELHDHWLTQHPNYEPYDYGPCAECGEPMIYDRYGEDRPHTWPFDDQRECHAECCPDCN